MKLSVIIVNFNTASYLKVCLQSIETCLKNTDHEVCVVDNASTDESVSMIRSQFPRVILHANAENRGFAAGINEGLRRTSGAYVMWLNPDTKLLDSGLEEVLAFMGRDAHAGIAGPQILDPDGGIQLSCRAFPSYEAALFNRYSLLTKWFPNNRFSKKYLQSDWDHQSQRTVDWVSGACLIHKREVSEALGGVDEGFFMYCEDVDFCFRAAQQGWKTFYHPGAKILHHIGKSSAPVSRRMIVERHKSIWHYYRKHFTRKWFRDAAVGFGLGLRLLFYFMLSWLLAKEMKR